MERIQGILLYTVWAVCILASMQACEESESNNFIKFEEVFIPESVKGGAQGNLYWDRQGNVIYSWISYLNDSTEMLKIGLVGDKNIENIVNVNSGSDWFVNWADFPSVSSFGGSQPALITHWLKKSDIGVYDYDINVSIGKEKDWSPPFILHDDHVAAEHGFVSYLPVTDEEVMVAWLDGRNTKNSEGEYDKHGTMMLRAAIVDKHGTIKDDMEVDGRTCECCQTDMAMTSKGPMIVYRDRSDIETRDIFYTVFSDSSWSKPKPIFNDNWFYSSCPVNGPAIDTYEDQVLVAWLTGAADSAEVKLILSEDGGESFHAPLSISNDEPLGRVDVKHLQDTQYIISWMGKDNEGIAELNISVYNSVTNDIIHKRIDRVSALRSSGFPRIALNETHLYITWTEVEETLNPKLIKISKSHLLAP